MKKQLNYSQFAKTLEKVIGKNAIKNYLPMQNGDVPYTFASSELLEKLTGFKPNTEAQKVIKNFMIGISIIIKYKFSHSYIII